MHCFFLPGIYFYLTMFDLYISEDNQNINYSRPGDKSSKDDDISLNKLMKF